MDNPEPSFAPANFKFAARKKGIRVPPKESKPWTVEGVRDKDR